MKCELVTQAKTPRSGLYLRWPREERSVLESKMAFHSFFPAALCRSSLGPPSRRLQTKRSPCPFPPPAANTRGFNRTTCIRPHLATKNMAQTTPVDPFNLLFRPRKPTSASASSSIPWVEKYRPKTLDQVVYQDEVVAVLKKCLSGMDFPHFLFYGPPGTGKTSTILALAHEMFGKYVKERVLELNASDERGIDVIREKVKNFSSSKVPNKLPDGSKAPAIRIVILDEADSMTIPAQTALRRVIETSTETTRFCLICNYVTRIIDPISSRCTKFRFKPLAKSLILERLQAICKAEKLNYQDQNVLEQVIDISEGDLRKAITSLHSVARLKSSETSEDPITIKDIYEVLGNISNDWIKKVVSACASGNAVKIEETVTDLMAEGYSGSQFLLQLTSWILESDQGKSLKGTNQITLLKNIAAADMALLEGCSEYLQILAICSRLSLCMKDLSGELGQRSFRAS